MLSKWLALPVVASVQLLDSIEPLHLAIAATITSVAPSASGEEEEEKEKDEEEEDRQREKERGDLPRLESFSFCWHKALLVAYAVRMYF